jgi:phosphinothricin acetyltransferase
MTGGLRLRDAKPEDSAVIAEIYNQSIAAANATMDDEPKTAADIRRQVEGFTDREGYWMLDRDGEPVGWGVIKLYSPRPGYSRCAETSVYLYQHETRKGYGSFIKRALIERCKQYGYHHLIARVWADNVASVEYNRRLGYEVVGIQREIGYIDGHWQDIAIMQLVLEDVGAEVADRYGAGASAAASESEDSP